MKTGDTSLGFVHHDTAGSNGFVYEKLSLKNKTPGLEIGFVAGNVEEAFNRAVKAGAIATSQPTKKPWGQVVSYVRDCNCLLIEVCSVM